MTELKFGVNRMVAPTLALTEFFDLAAAVGAIGVELRNDLPGFDVIDDLDPGHVAALLVERGLEVLTINAVQHFNLPSAVGEAMTELKRLIEFAGKLGNPAIVMCPHCDTSDDRSRVQMARDTKATLQQYLPVLEDAGVVGLVEPLGFPESSLRDPSVAAEILGEIGSDAYRITLDTFHFAVAGMDPAVLGTDAVPVERIGIIHASGVIKDGPVNAFRDPDRIYVDENDRCGNTKNVRRLRERGFTGTVSFEPFSPAVHAMSSAEMKNAIIKSIEYMHKLS